MYNLHIPAHVPSISSDPAPAGSRYPYADVLVARGEMLRRYVIALDRRVDD